MTNYENYLNITAKAVSQNEQYLRSAIASFCVELEPTVEEINDIKTAVSEAVTNCIVHGYESKGEGEIFASVGLKDKEIEISIVDNGVGITDIDQAKKPFYTTKEHEERAGMGFCVMEALMDEVVVTHNEDGGITVFMKKIIK